MTAPGPGPDAASWTPPGPDRPPPVLAWRAWTGLRSAIGRNPIADCTTCGRRMILLPYAWGWEHTASGDPAVFCDRVEPRPDGVTTLAPPTDPAHHPEGEEPTMSDQPDYAPARLAREVAAALSSSAQSADESGQDWSQRLDALAAQARYSAGVLDGLSTILPTESDPAIGAHWSAPARPHDDVDTVRSMRAALDRILGHTGHPVNPRADRIAPDAVADAVEARIDALHERTARAVRTGQQYAAKVDQLVAELDTARARIAELEGDTPAGQPHPGLDGDSPAAPTTDGEATQ